MTEHLLSTLGLALRAGAVAVGEEPVGAAARAKKARVIFTARDAAASSVRRAYSFGRAGSCLCLPFPADKETFGRALGRTSVAMCAVTDIGFAQSLVKKLAAAEPEIYGAAAEALQRNLPPEFLGHGGSHDEHHALAAAGKRVIQEILAVILGIRLFENFSQVAGGFGVVCPRQNAGEVAAAVRAQQDVFSSQDRHCAGGSFRCS